MKRKILSILLACIMIIMLSACGKPFICDFCGDEKTGQSHTMNLLGEESHVCHECYTELKELSDALIEG